MRWGRALIVVPSILLGVVACSSQRHGNTKESLGQTGQPLVALGAPCVTDAQCTPAGTNDAQGHCVDAVCCNTSCGNGARDAFTCSAIYGPVAGLVPGQCKFIAEGEPCGNIEAPDVGNLCRYRSRVLDSINLCPDPFPGSAAKNCYTCVNSSQCADSRPVCLPGNPPPDQPLDVYFMLDHSASMGADCILGTNGTSEWCEATNALGRYFTSPTSTGNRAALQFFTQPFSSCSTGAPHDVPKVALTDLPAAQTDQLMLSLEAETPVFGFNTRIESAIRGIVKYTNATHTAGRGTVGVLITDADANECNTDPTALGKILSDHFANTGIPTFLIGMNGASFDKLEIIATGGGAPAHGPEFCAPGVQSCHYYSVGNGSQAAFDAALRAIEEAARGSCEECNSNNGTGGAQACPTTAKPVCLDGGCVICTPGNPNACVAGCEGSTNTCSTCTGDFVAPPSAGNPRPCGGTRPVCLPGGNECVQCDSSDDCTRFGNPNSPTPICKVDTHTCVACLGNTDCPSSAPICEANACQPCNDDFGGNGTRACPSSTAPECVDGSCQPCRPGGPTPPAEGCTAALPVCIPGSPTNTCGECGTSADCPQAEPVCNPTTHTCGQCATNADCSGNTPICGAQDTCVPCNGNAGSSATNACPAGAPFCDTTGPNAGSCGQCTPENPNACVGATPVCDPTSNTCVPCTADSQCPSGVCDEATGTCPCTDNAQCSGTRPICTGGTCVPCDGDFGSNTPNACPTQGNPQCLGPDAGTGQGSCAQCETSADCPANLPVCNPQTHVCQPTQACTPDGGQCSGTTPVCGSNGGCVPCDGDFGSNSPNACPTSGQGQCLSADAGAAGGSCVECETSAQCPADKPVCNPTSHTCGTASCSLDGGQCSGTTPVCRDGNCGPCTADSQCPTGQCNEGTGACAPCLDAGSCPASTPICSNGTCVACTVSSQCPADKPICNPATHACQANPIPCTTAAQCPGDLPICDPQSKVCVQCTDNTQCPTGQVCNPTSHKCTASVTDGGPDSGPDSGRDAGPTPDSGPRPDGGTPQLDAFSVEGGGCDATIASSNESSTAGRTFLGLGVVFLLGLRRRVRRRR